MTDKTGKTPSTRRGSAHWPIATRRTVLGGMAALGAASLVRPASAATAEPPLEVKDWLLRPGASPLVLPSDYLGLHSDHGVSRRVAAPTYPYDAIRSHDVDNGRGEPATQWANIEVKPGIYDWRLTDRWFATHRDKTRTWVLFGCPSFYQKYPGERFTFPSLPGGGSPPRDPQAAARFVTALLERYPGQIQFLEIWNEPNFGPGTDPEQDRWTPDLPDAGWFTGSASDLAEMARAIRAVLPPTTKLMAGAWAWQGKSPDPDPGNSVIRFAQAPDRGGGVGRDHVQVISVHLYTYHNDPNELIEELRNYDSLFAACGYPQDMPRYVSEVGAWTYPDPPDENSPSLADQVRNVKRWCMIPAALGYVGVYLYKHSSRATLGDPAHVPEIAAAIAEMREGLRAKTVVSAALLADDTLWLSFADGTQLRA